jgi:cyclohexadienyl dehydratase
MSCRRSALVVGLLLGLGAVTTSAEPERVLRVGTSGDYLPFSLDAQDGPEGFDIEVARRFADDQEWQLEFVSFRWPELLEGLVAKKFDVAMSGVTVRPERSVAGRFSVPVATSGALVLVHGDSPYLSADDLRLPGIRLAVNAGGHLENIAHARFPRATILAIPDNRAVLAALLDHKVDAVVTDDLEEIHWRAQAPGLRPLGLLSRDRKAYLWGIENAELARRLDAWILARERDGTLAELRTEHLGPTRPIVATPLGALLAAIDERLDLMPAVASAKRREGSVVRAPEREQKVLTAAMASTSAAAAQAETAPLPELRVRALFRAQIEAAIAVQQAVLSAPADPSAPSLDLETELRPALLRIGDRIAWLLVRLPGPLDPGDVDRQTSEALDAPGLERHHEAAIADAIAQLSLYRR